MNRLLLYIITLISAISLIGCTSNHVDNKAEPQKASPLSTASNYDEMLKKFEKDFPKAAVVGKVKADVDNDSQEDLILIFENQANPAKITRSNVCVITRQTSAVIDIAGGDTNYEFAEGADSLKILQDPVRMSIMMNDLKEKKRIEYQVTFTIDNNEHKTNFKIETFERKETAETVP